MKKLPPLPEGTTLEWAVDTSIPHYTPAPVPFALVKANTASYRGAFSSMSGWFSFGNYSKYGWAVFAAWEEARGFAAGRWLALADKATVEAAKMMGAAQEWEA